MKRKRPEENIIPVWMSQHTKDSLHPLIQLQNEIIDYGNYITLNKEDIKLRERSIHIIKESIKALWPDCEAEVYGSYTTGLSLFNSDVDMIIFPKEDITPENAIRVFSRHLEIQQITSNQKKILKTRVPILKLTLKETGIQMDIAVNKKDSLKSITPIRELLVKYPPLKWLVLIIKAVLRQAEFNETYKGGIGSFLVIMLVTGYLQYEKKLEPKEFCTKSLGELLVKFFKFYADGYLYSKSYEECTLSVESPQDVNRDIGRPVKFINEIRYLFYNCYQNLAFEQNGLNGIITLTRQ